MTSEGVDVDPSSEGPPDQNTGPPGQEHNIEATLRQLNTNMGTITQLLTEMCARLPDRDIFEYRWKLLEPKPAGHRPKTPKTALRFPLL